MIINCQSISEFLEELQRVKNPEWGAYQNIVRMSISKQPLVEEGQNPRQKSENCFHFNRKNMN